jgi:hypothetical protein
MTLPGVSQTILDGQLGVTEPGLGVPLVFGASTAGTVGGFYSFAKPSSVISTLGNGDLVEQVCHILQVAGGAVHCVKTAASVAAANSAVTASGGGPTVTVAGTATNHYDAILEIIVGGALGTATFTYTLDGGQTTSPVITVPGGGSYVIPNTGITATFAAGTYVATETYSFTTTPATYNGADLSDAVTVALNQNEIWSFAVFAGYSASASAAATLFSAIDGHLTTLANKFRYLRAIISTGDDTPSAVNAAFDAVSSRRIYPLYAKARIATANAFVGWSNPHLPFSFGVAARCAEIKPSTSPAWVGLGGLTSVSDPTFDERQNGEILHSHKIGAPTTYIGRSGTYVTNGLLKSPAGSDFRYWQWGRIIDIASLTTYQGMLPYVNSSPRALVDGTGRIDPRDAARMNGRVNNGLNDRLITPVTDEGTKGYVSGAQFAIDETINILTSSRLQGDTRVVPRPQAEQVETTIALTQTIGNPETEATAA